MRHIYIQGVFEVCEYDELTDLDKELLLAAFWVRENARVPVSGFKVGAALRPYKYISAGKFGGCNVEDVAHTSTIHAEASALAHMISSLNTPDAQVGRIAIVLGKGAIACPPKRIGERIREAKQITATPCGHCRCLLAQYSHPTAQCLCLQPNGEIVIAGIQDFYPCGFTL